MIDRHICATEIIGGTYTPMTTSGDHATKQSHLEVDMPPPELISQEAFFTICFGAVTGFAGAGVTSILEELPRSKVIAALTAGMFLGGTIPPVIGMFWKFPPVVAMFMGLVAGLCCLSLVAGVQAIGKVFARRPQVFFPQLGNAMKDDGKEGKNVTN